MREQDKSLDEIYFFWIDQLSRAKKQATSRLFEELKIDLSVDQWIILKRLSELDGLTQKELSSSTLRDPASLTRTLDILVNRDLVERQIGTDRRSFEVHLTKKGRSLVNEIIPHAVKKREQGLLDINQNDLNIFRKVVGQMIENFEKM